MPGRGYICASFRWKTVVQSQECSFSLKGSQEALHPPNLSSFNNKPVENMASLRFTFLVSLVLVSCLLSFGVAEEEDGELFEGTTGDASPSVAFNPNDNPFIAGRSFAGYEVSAMQDSGLSPRQRRCPYPVMCSATTCCPSGTNCVSCVLDSRSRGISEANGDYSITAVRYWYQVLSHILKLSFLGLLSQKCCDLRERALRDGGKRLLRKHSLPSRVSVQYTRRNCVMLQA